MNPKTSSMIIACALCLLLSAGAGAQDISQAQAECRSIAQQQTGNAAPAATQPQAGGRARGAAAGAMAGAVKGKSKSNQYGNVPDEVAEEYTRNQMQDAAKAGVAVGAARQRQQRRQAMRDQQQQGGSATAFDQAYAACMTAKGFPGQ